jgi:hypothetical protein
VASFPLAFPPTTYARPSSPPFVLHAPQWPPSLCLSHQQPMRVTLLSHSCYMPRPSRPLRLHYADTK